MDKSSGLDGWTPDFFIFFKEFFIDHIWVMVEEAMNTGKIIGALNSTFIVLIPKEKENETFDSYRPISLCNSLYKIISKIIAERMKKVLSRFITQEQTGFLRERSIHDAVASTQEIIHSLHS